MEGQIYLITVPPGWTIKEAIVHLGIQRKPNDIVVEAVWLGEGTEPKWLKSEEPEMPFRGNDHIPGEGS